ncbi:MAG: hypothetical protein P1P65_04985 [Treponema sp.]
MTKKTLNTVLVYFLVYFILAFSACNPAIGTPWYPRVADKTVPAMFSIKITVAGSEVTPVLSGVPKDELQRLEFYAAAKEYTVTVPYTCEELSASDIAVKAVSSLINKEPLTVEVTMNGETVPLIPGKALPVTIKIQDMTGTFGISEKVIKVTRRNQAAMQQNLELVSLEVHGIAVDTASGAVAVPYAKSSVSSGDIKAVFKLNDETTVIPVEVEHSPIELQENKTAVVKIRVQEKAGQYNAFEKEISVLREQKKEDEDTALELESLTVLGFDALSGTVLLPDMGRPLTPDDVVAAFKDFGVLNVVFENGPLSLTDTALLTISIAARKGSYLAWEKNIRLVKDPAMVINPQDKHGNKKYIMSVKTTEEEIEPFDYYTDSFAFSAAQFDDWIVYISGFNNSTNIASYQFKPGTWTGVPDQYAGPDFGSGLKAMGNVKFYRYKSRKDRWNGTPPPLFDAEKEKRFYFYRFTASGGVSLDNSMFCVDTHSKFLFYYSDPDSISGVGVPSGWTDYAAPSSGSHRQFNKPFYLSDPVGFVKEDGQVVLYSWIKENITNNNYTAQENPAFTKPAEQKASGAGYSPYRDKIKRKKQEVIRTDNPAYTVTVPNIVKQPAAIRMNPNGEAQSFEVRVAEPPAGEVLSYQWYENSIQSDQGGIPIAGADGRTYTPDNTEQKDCYVYCAVTNTNTANGAVETVRSYAVKLLIKEGSLTIDAEQPRIIKQPESYVIPINTSKEVKLKVEALSMDKGALSYQWYKAATETAAGEKIETANTAEYSFKLENTDTGAAGKTFYYCEVTNTNNMVDGKKTAVLKTNKAVIEIEESYQLIFNVNDPDAGRVVALNDGKPIELNSYVKKGSKIQFLAFCNPQYETQAWTGAKVTKNINLAEITVNSEEDAKNTVCDMAYIPPGKLTVTPKMLKNLTFNNHSSGDDGYFVHDFRISNYYDTAKSDDFVTVWEKYKGKKIPIWGEVAIWHNLNTNYQIAHYIKENQSKINNKGFAVKYEYVKLDTELIHYHGKYSGDTYYYPTSEEILSDYRQSAIAFKYDRGSSSWKCNTPNNFNIPHVTVSYPADFTLKQNETKDFVIKYDYAGKGSAEVTYTLKWE